MLSNVMVYLEDSQSNSYDELLRCGHLVCTDESGEECIASDILDSSGFHCREDLIREVTGVLGVTRERVWLIE